MEKEKAIKIVTLTFMAIILIISSICVYEKGVNGGCSKEFKDYKASHPIEDYGSWSCGYDFISILILFLGGIGLLFAGIIWDTSY